MFRVTSNQCQNVQHDNDEAAAHQHRCPRTPSHAALSCYRHRPMQMVRILKPIPAKQSEPQRNDFMARFCCALFRFRSNAIAVWSSITVAVSSHPKCCTAVSMTTNTNSPDPVALVLLLLPHLLLCLFFHHLLFDHLSALPLLLCAQTTLQQVVFCIFEH